MRLDEIGYWSELKLEIIKKYAQAYSTILAAQQSPRLKHVCIDQMPMRTTSSVIDVFRRAVGVGLTG